MNIDYSSVEAEKGSSKAKPAAELLDNNEDGIVDDLLIKNQLSSSNDGFSNMTEPFSSYYPY